MPRFAPAHTPAHRTRTFCDSYHMCGTTQDVAKLQRDWDNLADSTLEKNTARTPDSVPFVVPLVPFVAPHATQ